MTKVLQKKDRVLESINATREDIENLYVVAILDKVTYHFEKKVFGKEKEFQKEASEVRQKHLKAVKCIHGWDRNIISNPTVQTIDGVTVNLSNILESLGERSMYAQEELMEKLCYKYDKGKGGEFTIIPVLQEKVKNFWIHFE
tara:strand:+ start:2052 stop:2480 length:429 start_codon:yes stop_codon:yes gene_type:complete